MTTFLSCTIIHKAGGRFYCQLRTDSGEIVGSGLTLDGAASDALYRAGSDPAALKLIDQAIQELRDA